MNNISKFEKLVVILQKFSIDFNEFNVKFEKSERQEAITNQRIILNTAANNSSWSSYPLSCSLDAPRHLGNGVYAYNEH